MKQTAIEVQGLSYHYPDGRQAIHDISFTLMSGEKVALLGPNGAGKTTLLLQLNGILMGKGDIKICDLSLNPKTLKRIRAMVGVVFQNPDDQLFSPTVYDDIAYGPNYQGMPQVEIEERVIESLVAVNLEEFSQRNPTHLSSGEKKRVAIASVLSMDPPILVLDEPTAGLDPRATRELTHLLISFPQTMLIATHALDLALHVTTRSIVLYQGMIVADQPTDVILKDHDFLFRYGLS